MRDKILTYLDKTEHEQFRLLEKLILQESHTLDKEGVDLVGKEIENSLRSLELVIEKFPEITHGNHLVFRSKACRQAIQQILLVGHMDTVFAKGSPFNSYREDQDKAYGPGIIDMKGGLVTAIFALKALDSIGLLSQIPLVLLCNSDEETGSTTSKSLIMKEARKSSCALVFECGGLHGEVVTGRKGKAGYTLEVMGKAGHAAFMGGKPKASSILEISHKTIKIEALNDNTNQLVVNVGTSAGGSGPNVVAEHATAKIDTRFLSATQGEFCQQQLKAITEETTITGTHAKLIHTSGRPPMEQTQGNHALYTIFKEQADLLGLPLIDELRSGVSDANTLASCGVPVLDGLGPIGDKDHSEDEYMIKKSLRERCQLAALGILAIWEKHHSP